MTHKISQDEFAALSKGAQVRRLRLLAEEAAREFGLRGCQFRLRGHGENTVFEVHGRRGRSRVHFALRIAHPSYHSDAGVLDELAWLRLIADEDPWLAPIPQRSPSGEELLRVSHEAVAQPRQCTLFSWVDGRFFGKGLKPIHFERVGRLTATVQRSGRKLPKPWFPNRLRWDFEGLCGASVGWGDLNLVPEVTAAQRALFDEARAAFKEILVPALRQRSRVGPIHADLHHGNYVFSGEDARAIDFDDCAVGHYLYDVAVTLGAVSLTGPRYEPLRDGFFRGYIDAGGPLELPRDLEVVRAFMVARRFLLTGWCHSRRDNPEIREFIPMSIERSVSAAKRFLAGEDINE